MTSETWDIIKDRLWSWQIEFLQCDSDKALVAKCRQIGLSTALALLSLLHSSKHSNHNTYILSTTVTQARDDVLSYAKDLWIPILRENIDFYQNTEILRNEIRLPNGSIIKAEAAKPNKLRGKRGSFLLDEAAFYPKRYTDSIESAISPIIDRNPNSIWRVVSTKWTRENNWFADLVLNEGDRYHDWRRFEWNIYDCIEGEESFQFDIEGKKQEKTQAQWKTEYLCEFLELSDYYFSRSTLSSLQTSYHPPLDNHNTYIGIDIGREHDRTAIVVIDRWEDLVIVRTIRQMRNTRFREQEKIIGKILQSTSYDKCMVDKTAHPALVEGLGEDFSNVYGFQGNRERKVQRTQELKRLTEQSNIIFQKDNKIWKNETWRDCDISMIDDLTNVSQEFTPAENIRFTVNRDEDGHGDTYSALLLALHGSHHQTMQFFGSS